MAAARKRRKAPAKKKPRRWIFLKVLMLLGIGGLTAFLIAIFVMEQELNRIGFFSRIKRPSFQLPTPSQRDSPTTPGAAPLAPPASDESSQQKTSQPPAQGRSARVTEDISQADRKKRQDTTASRPTEHLSEDDRKGLADVLRKR